MIIENNPGDSVYNKLRDAILTVRPADCPDVNRMPSTFSILERDEGGEIKAGTYSYVHPAWIYIDLLWVSQELRGKGLGSKMLAETEAEGLRRGCISAWLWTMDFEAAGFYKKHGYKEFVVFEDFIPGHNRYGFMKKLEQKEIR